MTDDKKVQEEPGGKAVDESRIRRRKTIIAAGILLLPFSLCIYLIFSAGGVKETVPGDGDINLTLPDGRGTGIEASKQKAIERVNSQKKQTEGTLSADMGALSLLPDEQGKEEPESGEDAIVRSREARREAEKVVSGFYSAPRSDSEIERLKRQVDELSMQLEQPAVQTPDPMELAEKQFQLASKYLGPGREDKPKETDASQEGKDKKVFPVRAMGDNTVTSLAAPGPDPLAAELGRERNLGFTTAVGTTPREEHNGIRVCIDEDQTLTAGDRIRLRLTEPIRVGGRLLTPGTVLFGAAGIEGQRLMITVESIEANGDIFPVELSAYDLDGAKGLYIPDSKERTAVKDAAAGIASGLGTGISFARSAGQQVAMDLVRGAMSGGSQYAASKLRQVKVNVKAGYQLLLISKD